MNDLTAAGQGSTESEAGWFDLFSSRYWKGIKIKLLEFFVQYFEEMNMGFSFLSDLLRLIVLEDRN